MTTQTEFKSNKPDSSGKPQPPPLPAKRATKPSSPLGPMPKEMTANPDAPAERRVDYNRVYMNFAGTAKHFSGSPSLTWDTFLAGCKEELPLLASWLVLIIYLGSTYCRNAEQVKLLRGEVTYNKQTMESLVDEQSKKAEHYFQSTLKLGEDLSAQKLHIEEVEAHWKFVNDKQTAALERLRADVETTNRLIAAMNAKSNLNPLQDTGKTLLTQSDAATAAAPATDTASATPPVVDSAPSQPITADARPDQPILSVNDSPTDTATGTPVTAGQSAEEAASNDPLVAANRNHTAQSEQK